MLLKTFFLSSFTFFCLFYAHIYAQGGLEITGESNVPQPSDMLPAAEPGFMQEKTATEEKEALDPITQMQMMMLNPELMTGSAEEAQKLLQMMQHY